MPRARPRPPEARAALGERDAHAVQCAHAVQPRRERVVQVVLEITGRLDVHHQERPVHGKRRVGPGEYPRRVGLVVDRVEGTHRTERHVGGQFGHVERLERRVGQTQLFSLGARGLDCIGRQVVPDEGRARESSRHHRDGVAGAAAEVGDADPRSHPVDEVASEGQDAVQELAVHQPPGHAVHHVGELGPERLVRDAPALPERSGHRADLPAKLGPDPGHRSQVQRPRTAQTRGVLRGEQVSPRCWIERHDPRGDQRTETLADVALLQACPCGQPVASVRARCQHLEQSRPVRQIDHQSHEAVGVDPEEPIGEHRDPSLVRSGGGDDGAHDNLPPISFRAQP